MVLINKAINEVTVKLVYYGPGLCGKTTNLEKIYANPKLDNKGKMISMATETDRTLFFDFMPMELGTIAGQKVRVQLYTVPGQVFYDATRKLVLRGADGVVFVADSQKSMRESNIDSFENLKTNLRLNRLDPNKVALVFQYNKRDLPNAESVEEMNAYLNPGGAPAVEAVALQGTGVTATLRAAVARILDNLKNHVDTTLYDAPELTAPDMQARSGVTPSSAGTPKLSMKAEGSFGAPAAAPAAAPQQPQAPPATPFVVPDFDETVAFGVRAEPFVAPAPPTPPPAPVITPIEIEPAAFAEVQPLAPGPFEAAFGASVEPVEIEDDPFESTAAGDHRHVTSADDPFTAPASPHSAEREELEVLLAKARQIIHSLETTLEHAREHERSLDERLHRLS